MIANTTVTAMKANAFALTFACTHRTSQHECKQKSMQANAHDSARTGADTTRLRGDRRAADNKGLTKWRVTSIFKLYRSFIPLCVGTVKCLEYRHFAKPRTVISLFRAGRRNRCVIK